MWLKGEPTNKTCFLFFSHQLQGGSVTCPLNQSNEVFVCVLKIPKVVG